MKSVKSQPFSKTVTTTSTIIFKGKYAPWLREEC